MRVWSLLVGATAVAGVVAACGGGAGDGTTVFPPDGSAPNVVDGNAPKPDNYVPPLGYRDGSMTQPDGFVVNPTDSGGKDGSHGTCSPKTCASSNASCGPIGDGCGDVLDCGSCMPPQTCGGGGVYSVCGGTSGCVPRTCASVQANCGPVADGCGNLLNCGSCTAPQTCGGGQMPSQCGGHSACIPATCASAGKNCGPVADGCGNLLNCGTCTAPETCGGGGAPASVCGLPNNVDAGGLDAGSICVPKTCAQKNINCGPAGDGCGNLIDCGSCQAPETCGGGMVPSVCGGMQQCIPKTCAQQNIFCGPSGDGCGKQLDCGTCSAPQTCGGGGVLDKCGGMSACVPKTCAQENANCGKIGDGCGNLLDCGSTTCPTSGDFCGGGGPNLCGPGNVDAGVACTNLCPQIVACAPGVHTTVTGTVYAPTNPALGYGNPDPLPNALVYIPNAPVQPFPTGISCDQCGAAASGQPLVSATTDFQGNFTLVDPPAGANIPLVIQIGRWRRQVTISNIASCVANPKLPAALTRLPRNHNEGDIPKIAIVTGSADPIECVLPKIGIDASEFTDPAGGGRVQFYQANGATISGTTPNESVLWGDQTTLDSYDLVIFDCEGGRYDETAAALANVQAYANAGGRIFASHFSYVWGYTNQPWGCGANCVTANSTVADWTPDVQQSSSTTATIDTGSGKGLLMNEWLDWVLNAKLPQMPAVPVSLNVSYPRYDVNYVIAGGPATQFVYDATNVNVSYTAPLEFTFNTPAFALPANQCGRFLFSDFHVNTGGSGRGNFFGGNGQIATGECGAAAPMTPQEKVLEFMLFDLGSCITPTMPPPPMCVPVTCAQQNFNCGPQSDSCGNVIQCGNCTPPKVCGGGGPGQCGGTACVPTTCQQQNLQCGPAGDGCGKLLDCGACNPPQTCGGGGVSGQCGAPMCNPRSCANQGIACGPAGNGCGGLLQCGTCPNGQSCGGGGVPGQCGAVDGGACVPQSCAKQNLNCGPAGDGCGAQIDCGMCTPPATCGGGGVPGQCGGMPCVPKTCAAQMLSCGPAGDGCGKQIDCGTCTPPQTCGGGGKTGMCGMPSCVPTTCAAQGFTCGPAGDGCGGLLQCGVCTTAGDTCGGGGTPNQCGGHIN